MFNTLRYTKSLEAVGFPREQAEAQVQIIAEIIEGDVATKQDLKNLETRLDSKFDVLEHRMLVKISAATGAIVTLALSIFAFFFRLH